MMRINDRRITLDAFCEKYGFLRLYPNGDPRDGRLVHPCGLSIEGSGWLITPPRDRPMNPDALDLAAAMALNGDVVLCEPRGRGWLRSEGNGRR